MVSNDANTQGSFSFDGIDLTPITEQVEIDASPAFVWRLLRDPHTVVGCIPGAELTGTNAAGSYLATVAVKFGPAVAKFRGEADVDYDDANMHCRIAGRGIDGRGASRALARATVTLSGSMRTTLQVDGGFNVTGPLETFANAGGVHVARALLADFAKNMALLAARESASAEAPEPDKTTPTSISAGSIVMTALVSWLKSTWARWTGRNAS